tara:strand:+ start:15364 stop:15510 length:147 start_codon:yes stop_codon:yes gene_type:complete
MSKEKHETWRSMYEESHLKVVKKPNRSKSKIKKFKKPRFKNNEDYGNI